MFQQSSTLEVSDQFTQPDGNAILEYGDIVVVDTRPAQGEGLGVLQPPHFFCSKKIKRYFDAN